MGLFDRFRRVVKSNINDMISKSENPEKMLTQLIEDMNGQLIESKKAVAGAIADEKQLERQLLQQRSQAEDWEKRAVLAVHRKARTIWPSAPWSAGRSSTSTSPATRTNGRRSATRSSSSRDRCAISRRRSRKRSARRTS